MANKEASNTQTNQENDAWVAYLTARDAINNAAITDIKTARAIARAAFAAYKIARGDWSPDSPQVRNIIAQGR